MADGHLDGDAASTGAPNSMSTGTGARTRRFRVSLPLALLIRNTAIVSDESHPQQRQLPAQSLLARFQLSGRRTDIHPGLPCRNVTAMVQDPAPKGDGPEASFRVAPLRRASTWLLDRCELPCGYGSRPIRDPLRCFHLQPGQHLTVSSGHLSRAPRTPAAGRAVERRMGRLTAGARQPRAGVPAPSP